MPTTTQIRAAGTGAGLDVVEVTTAEPFEDVRETLEARKEEGLHGGMMFTYRNPARSTDPGRSVEGARSLVVAAKGYLTEEPVIDLSGPVGRIARYAWSDHYAALRLGLESVAEVLREHGWKARIAADDNALVDRAAAHRAGIGWWGKNANLLLPRLGSWYVLGSVITDAPLAPSGERVTDRCGTCTRCIDSCPTAAITAPGVVDARRCLSWLLQAEGVFPREHRAALGGRIYGCDDCQDVCPPNRRTPIAVDDGRQRPVAPLLELLDPDDAVVLAHAERWYIPRRELRYVRRNALVVLGNVGDGRHADVVHLLERYLAHEDPLLRAHAVWAARRLGREDLTARLTDDPDPLVRDELEHPTTTR
ncbi:MAG TPA: tRNA epoxyqueuosine(34) reductase QueG [Acidimicrobiales bacterium]